MSARVRFSAIDLARAIKAFERAGLHVTGAKISPATGEIVVLTGSPEAANDAQNPLDRVLPR